MNKDQTTSTAAAAGVIGVAALLGAPAVGIAAGCGWLVVKLLESQEDPNTIGHVETPAPHRTRNK